MNQSTLKLRRTNLRQGYAGQAGKLFLFGFLFLGLISPAFCIAMDSPVFCNAMSKPSPSSTTAQEGAVQTDGGEETEATTQTFSSDRDPYNPFDKDGHHFKGQFYSARAIRITHQNGTSNLYPNYDPIWQNKEKSLREKIQHTATKHSTTSAAQGFGRALGENVGVILAQMIIAISKFAYEKTLKPVKVYIFGKGAPSLEEVITQANLTEKQAHLVLAMQQTALSEDENPVVQRQRESLARLIESNGHTLDP